MLIRSQGSYHFKFQYALKTFHWNSVQLGYWLSLVGFWRAVHLSIVLPIILKTLYARKERLAGNAQTNDEKEAALLLETALKLDFNRHDNLFRVCPKAAQNDSVRKLIKSYTPLK